MISRPIPSRNKLMATTTISTTVIVRLRRRPIQISWNTKLERMLPESLDSPCEQRGQSVGLAVHSARLVTHNLAVLALDHALAHRVHDRRVMGRHHNGRAGPVDAVEHLHHPEAVARVDFPSRLVR